MDELTRRAERALLGAMIAAPRLMTWVRMRPGEFEDPRHASMLEAIVAARREAGRAGDTHRWRTAIVAAAPGVTSADLYGLVADCPDPRHGIAYAGLVVQAWAGRAVREAAETIHARARLLEGDSRQVMRFAMAEGLEAGTVARHMEDLAAAIRAHVSAPGRTPPSLDPVPGDSSPDHAQREEAVLTALLTPGPEPAGQVITIVDADAIRDPHRRAVFRAAREMHVNGMTVDALTLDWELTRWGVPLVRQQDDSQDGQTYATRLARSGATGEQLIQAARDLAAEHEQSLRWQQPRPAGRRPERSPGRDPQARRPEHPGLRLLRRPPEADGPHHSPEPGR